MKMYAKFHEQGRDKLLAACDEDLLGKTLDEFVVSERFYGGEIVEEKEFENRLDECTIANLIGESVINTAKKKGLVGDEGLILVSGVPHAQIVRMI